MFVKPNMHINCDGKPQQLLVRLPDKRLMPTDGMEIDETDLYFARLLRDKDIVPTEPPPAPKASKRIAADPA